ncbi:DNA polymerase III subunit beta [Herbidospora sp. NEAU-GS84]|uniref:DNA polymerase III subunit beta n=1 Tax=Herbidospora solisilvae TaxID=2696284 RepID=A0A7C9J334_9ACTN|nr:DNA polymerase III subunit beta [Herbidospora solisilvae]NAS22460.1 DNA polymerase III subunit beta [Herbidospora solisilvae]
MKISVDPKLLADAVGWAARVVPARPNLPVLGGLLLVAEGELLTISAFDYDTAARVEIRADVAEPGRVLVSARLLAEVAKGLPGRQFAELTLDGAEVVLRCGTSEYVLVTMPVDDFPTLPDAPPALGEVTGETFKAALRQVCPAADPSSAQVYQTAVQMLTDDGRLLLTATDTKRIAHRKVTWQPTLEAADIEMLVPAKALGDLARGLGAGPVQICGDDRLAGFTSAGRTFTTRLLADQFPNWRRARQMLQSPVTALVPVEELAEAVKRVVAIGGADTPVRLGFADDAVTVRSGNDGGRGSEVVACALEGGPLDLSFLPQVISDGLAAIDADNASIGMHAPGRGSLLVGEGDDDFEYIAMPLRAA